MPTSTYSRRIMVVTMIVVVALGGIALPAAARGGHQGRGDQQTQTDTARSKGRGAEAARSRGRSAEARQRRRAPKFVVVGFVTTVDTAEVTVRIKGGNKSLRKLGTPVEFTVADDARVKLNGERVELAALAAGDRVVVKGAKIGDVLTAWKVFASRRDEVEDEEVEDEASDDTESDEAQETEDVTAGDDTSTGDDTDGDTSTDGTGTE